MSGIKGLNFLLSPLNYNLEVKNKEVLHPFYRRAQKEHQPTCPHPGPGPRPLWDT